VIVLTRLNDRHLVLNAELIKIVEATPDTIITFINGDTIIVRESPEEVMIRAIDYQRKVHGFRLQS